MSVPGNPDPNSVADLPPLKPRPVLLVVLAIALVVWLGILVWMRLKTVDRPILTPASTQAASQPA